MKVNLISLGCPKNLVDSEKILGALGASGTIVCARPQDSDVVIVNTCGFIAPALEETKETIAQLLKEINNGTKIYVVGCAVNRYANLLKTKFPEVSGWFTLEDEARLIAAIETKAVHMESRLPTTHGYAYLKISDGCSNNCAYCTIPSIKGPHRSSDFNEIIREAYELAKLGMKELIIIGQDTTNYGSDLYARPRMRELLRELSQIPEVAWLRIMYAHPKTLDNAIIEEIEQNRKICKYIDLPIQHINDRLLSIMNRATTRGDIESTLARLKRIDNMSVRTTIIVGYPTETNEEFDELMDFISQGYFDWVGIFPYYREQGTPASKLKQLPSEVIEQRYAEAIALQQRLIKQKNRGRIGRRFKVLVHGREQSFIGHAKCTAPEIDSQILIADGRLEVGKIYEVRITGVKGNDMLGEMVSRKTKEQ